MEDDIRNWRIQIISKQPRLTNLFLPGVLYSFHPKRGHYSRRGMVSPHYQGATSWLFKH